MERGYRINVCDASGRVGVGGLAGGGVAVRGRDSAGLLGRLRRGANRRSCSPGCGLGNNRRGSWPYPLRLRRVRPGVHRGCMGRGQLDWFPTGGPGRSPTKLPRRERGHGPCLCLCLLHRLGMGFAPGPAACLLGRYPRLFLVRFSPVKRPGIPRDSIQPR